MGFARKKAGDIKKGLSTGLKSIKEDPWKAVALIAAPYALPAIGGAATGFMGKAAMGAKSVAGLASSFLPGGVTPQQALGGVFGGGNPLSNIFGSTGGQAADGGGGFFQGMKDKFSGVADKLGLGDKVKDPAYLAGIIRKAGAHLAGSKLAGDGLSDAERKLMAAISDDLGALRTNDQKAFDAQMGAAEELMGRADQYDPEYYGLKAQRDVQIAGGSQMREADIEGKMREGGRGLSAADRRRAGLEITRDAQSAYLEGRETGADMKTKTFAAGAGLIPSQAPNQALAGGLATEGVMRGQEKDRRVAVKDTGTFIEDVFGHDKPKSTGGLKMPTVEV